MTEYDKLDFKIPMESACYPEDSGFVISKIIEILDSHKNRGDNKIILNTNLHRGLPLFYP